jgi:hypothetical protein
MAWLPLPALPEEGGGIDGGVGGGGGGGEGAEATGWVRSVGVATDVVLTPVGCWCRTSTPSPVPTANWFVGAWHVEVQMSVGL